MDNQESETLSITTAPEGECSTLYPDTTVCQHSPSNGTSSSAAPPLPRTNIVRSRPAWPRWLARIPRDVVDLLLPPSCLCCHRSLDQSESFLCHDCLPTLGLIHHACLRCGAPLPTVVPETHGCLRCQGRSWSFGRAIAVGPYYGPLQKLVIAMKKLRHETTTLYFGKLLAARLMQTGVAQELDLIIPVPSHWWRRLVRKVSTAEVLAESVSSQLDIPWNSRFTWRVRHTAKQGMMRAADRKANVKGAFAAKLPSQWQGARILLVDDVLTSGSTANEVARVLLQAGAREVSVGAIARALGDQRTSFIQEQKRNAVPILGHPVANSVGDRDHGEKS